MKHPCILIMIREGGGAENKSQAVISVMIRHYHDPENGLHPQTEGDIPPSWHMKPCSLWPLPSPDLSIHLSGCQSETSHLWGNQRNHVAPAEHHLPGKNTYHQLNYFHSHVSSLLRYLFSKIEHQNVNSYNYLTSVSSVDGFVCL